MKDYFHIVTKWLSYNRWTALGLGLAAVLAFGMGCSTLFPLHVPNPFNPKEKVTAVEAQAIVDNVVAEHNKAVALWNAKVSAQSTDLAMEKAILDTEAENIENRVKAINTNIEVAEANRAAVFQTIQSLSGVVSQAAGAAGVPVTGGIAAVMTLLAGGLGADVLRKRTVIASLKDKCASRVKP